MVTPSQLTVLITAIGYPCRTYTMYISHRNPQLLERNMYGKGSVQKSAIKIQSLYCF